MRNVGQDRIVTGMLCAVGFEALYGLSFLFTKQATEMASIFTLLSWRFFVALVVMSLLALFGVVKINLKGKPIRPLLPVILFDPCLYFIGETIGVDRTTATESGVFLACIPVAALLASAVVLKKRPSGRQIVGILITLVGVLITVLAVGVLSSLSAVGYLLLVVTVLSYALYSVFVDRAARWYTGAEITYSMLIAGASLFVILALLEALLRGNMTTLVTFPFRERIFLTAILYQGIGCSIVAFLLNNMAIAKIGVNRTASFTGVQTVVTILAGALVLRETFTWWQLLGAVMILLGVYTANVRKKRQEESRVP